MTIKNLRNIDFEILIECFLECFAGYFVEMPIDLNYYEERWRMAKVDLGMSFGAFDGDNLVGFVIHAVDIRDNAFKVHNTGTGVLPNYRGRHIVDSIYDHALPILKEKGIEKSTLEVITENIPARRVYERIGFKGIKMFKCYHGAISIKKERRDFNLQKIHFDAFDWSRTDQNVYSWDNHIETLKRGPFVAYVVHKGSNRESYFVVNATTGYLAQFEVLVENEYSWERLFSAIAQISKTVKINNVDGTLNQKIDFLNHIGLINTVDQFEMELILK
ncbi:GNAT family N-acetyltransferase [Ulvibacterium marinum]|uniref:GNAT family N-acetyltransferase n=1 Tax=Ulvibacterium marinum TaxID=2419782 RepID=UPI002495709E|nr:GNAT family N-acetyltransferase [Ulvibacterium marinum]